MEGESEDISFGDLDIALSQVDTQLRLFGKPQVSGQRRMGVALARGDSIDQAREKANASSSSVSVEL